MSVDQKVSETETVAESFAHPESTDAEFEALKRAVAAFLSKPGAAEVETNLLRSIEQVAKRTPDGVQQLRQIRADQQQKWGAYTRRYVCTKCIQEDGSVEKLPRPRPARDRMLVEIRERVRSNPDRFPGGLDAFLREASPLFAADTKRFARIVQFRVQELLRGMPDWDAAQWPGELANVLDLLIAYRHSVLQNTESSPTALKIIDTGDVASMMEFLISAAARAPFTEAEFSRFLHSIADPAQGASDSVVILRGRIVNSGLEGTPGVLKRWITPFVRELSLRGKIPDLEQKYRERRSPAASSPRTEPTKQQPPAAPPVSRGLVTSSPPNSAMNVSNSDSGIPIGATEPVRLKILKDYLDIVPVSSVLSLQEAMQMAIADPEVEGHRQYVVRTFRQAGWTVIPRGNREPIFEKRPDPRQAANAPEGNQGA